MPALTRDESRTWADPAGLRAALRHGASALKAAEIPFALAGGYALWVRGAPESAHDVDIVVIATDVEAAAAALADADFTVERPDEDWLFKAYLDDAVVDVLHHINGVAVDAAYLAAAQETEVLGLRIPVLPAQAVVLSKLLAMTERYCDYGELLPAVRAVREQLDWNELSARTSENPFATTFLTLAERLGIVPTRSFGWPPPPPSRPCASP